MPSEVLLWLDYFVVICSDFGVMIRVARLTFCFFRITTNSFYSKVEIRGQLLWWAS